MGQILSECLGRTLIINEIKQCNNPDCDPDLKPSATAELENLVNRLEKLVDRLERSVSARELEIANRTFDSVIENKRKRSFDLENAELPPIPDNPVHKQLERVSENLDKRIDKLESCLNNINAINGHFKKDPQKYSVENIPTVLDDYLIEDQQESTNIENMSVAGYHDIINGPLAQYINLSNKIGGDVAQHAQFVKSAFNAQLQYVTLATQFATPSPDRQMKLLEPTSAEITRIQNFREKNRASPFFNHLSVISESIPALGWVCVSPTPGPHVKEMNDAGQFYSNRVLKEWKEKDPTHVEWARAWIQTLTDLQQYIKQYHTTGLVWSGKGTLATAPPPPPPAGCPPPPPPPVMALGDLSLGTGDERSALFAEINQGEGITRNLKKVTAEMQTHKNPTLRTGPAPFKTPQHFSTGESMPASAPVEKQPVFIRDGKKWLIEYQKSNRGLLVENAEMNNVVYVFRCQDSVLTVKGKINSIVMDSCKKCSILFDSVVSSVEFVNCQSVQMQVLGKVPTISIDKTDGCQMYLSNDSLNVEIISSKSSEMNVLIPKPNGEYTEQPIPEQYKTTIVGNSLQTICVESLG